MPPSPAQTIQALIERFLLAWRVVVKWGFLSIHPSVHPPTHPASQPAIHPCIPTYIHAWMHACMHRYMYLQIRCRNCLLTCLFVEDGLTGSAWGDWATTARRAWIFPPTECRVFGLFMLQSSSEKVLNTRRATATIASKAAAKEDCRLPQQALSFFPSSSRRSS